MSQRTFFDIRYTIPGAGFLLVILIINLYPIIEYIQQNFTSIINLNIGIGIFLAVITFFSGSTFGFIISQFWYGLFWIIRKYNLENENKYPYNVLCNEYNISKNNFVTVFHYFGCIPEKEVETYLSRRWDLINLFGSFIISLFIGSICGEYIKTNYFHKELFSNILSYDILVIGLIIILIVIEYKSLKWVLKENWDMLIFFIRKSVKEKNGIENIIPEHYRKKILRDFSEYDVFF